MRTKLSTRSRLALLLTVIFFLYGCGCNCVRAGGPAPESITAPDTVITSESQSNTYSTLPKDGLIIQSKYSKIKIIDEGPLRQLYFQWQDGTDHHQTTLVRATPWRQDESYTHSMLSAFLFIPRPKKIMLAGLGGGAIPHFIHHYKLTQQLDIVELDPDVVKVAREHFNLPQDPGIKVILGDVVEILDSPQYASYDLIFIDVLLNDLAQDTDSTGMPLKTRTQQTLTNIHSRLSPWGTVIFNLHINQNSMEDIEAIQSVFPQVYYWVAPGTGNLIISALKHRNRISPEEFDRRAQALDRRLHASFKFTAQADIVKQARYFNSEDAASEAKAKEIKKAK